MSLRLLNLSISSPSCHLRSLEVAVVPDHWSLKPAPIPAVSQLLLLSGADSGRGQHRERSHFKSTLAEGSLLSIDVLAQKVFC